jgi:hypothetical protein
MPRKRPYGVFICHFCDKDKHPSGKPFESTDPDAVIKGLVGKCGDCVRAERDIENLYRMNKR